MLTTQFAAIQPTILVHSPTRVQILCRSRQGVITEAFERLVVHDASGRAMLRRFHANTGVRTRHLALRLEEYEGLDGFGAANDAWIGGSDSRGDGFAAGV